MEIPLLLNEETYLVIQIPESSSGDTITYEIIKGSDGSVLNNGNMVFVRDGIWRVAYTPNVAGMIILKANDLTISSKRENVYRVF